MEDRFPVEFLTNRRLTLTLLVGRQEGHPDCKKSIGYFQRSLLEHVAKWWSFVCMCGCRYLWWALAPRYWGWATSVRLGRYEHCVLYDHSELSRDGKAWGWELFTCSTYSTDTTLYLALNWNWRFWMGWDCGTLVFPY